MRGLHKKRNFLRQDISIREKSMFESKEMKERVILVGVSVSDYDDVSSSLDELEDLAETAGAVCVGRLIQKREQIHPTSYLGKGKIMELKDLLWETEADGIICDDELSPAQISNLKAELETKIMDRTLLILDIFAARASTSEGKIQVELAQAVPPYRAWHFSFQTGRRNRDKRTRREKAGNGPKADQEQNFQTESGA